MPASHVLRLGAGGPAPTPRGQVSTLLAIRAELERALSSSQQAVREAERVARDAEAASAASLQALAAHLAQATSRADAAEQALAHATAQHELALQAQVCKARESYTMMCSTLWEEGDRLASWAHAYLQQHAVQHSARLSAPGHVHLAAIAFVFADLGGACHAGPG